jgi:TolB-like protein/DNA-binding winged helix-turn-helix (wHTH) protein/Tfp pilus assembly protein PilF
VKPAVNAPEATLYEFDDFRLDTAKRLLLQGGAPVPLTSRVFDTLLYMVEHPNTVLDKERLMEAVWPDSIVEENNLTQNISTLRRVFGETPGSHRFIVTVPGRGYRFVAKVKTCGNGTESTEQPMTAVTTDKAPATIEPAPGAPPLADGPRNFRPLFFAALALLLVAVGAIFFLRGKTQRSAESPARLAMSPTAISEKSIAVLPFENLSADPENAYFATGIQDEILSNLAKISDLKVISRTSANLYRADSPRNAHEIGLQLGVAHLLEGSVQRAGDRVRVNAQLIDTRSDAHIWAQSYDRKLADVFAIQSEMAQTIAQQLQVRISTAEQAAISQVPTSDLVANALYAQAWNSDPAVPEHQALLQSVRLLEEAVTRDPHFLLAYCALAQMHLTLYFGGYDHAPARRDLAKVAIENAARIDPDAGEVHLTRAQYFLHGFRDYDRARAELDIARRTLPNNPKIYHWSAVLDRRQARWEQAVRNYDRAVELDPRNVEFITNAAGTYERLRRYPEAAQMYERAIAIAPQDQFARIFRALLPLHARGDLRPIRAELDAIVAEKPSVAPTIADVLFLCAMLERDSAQVRRILTIIPPQGMAGHGNFVWPREWFAGLAARTFNDPATARTSFTAARAILDKIVREQPDYADAWSLLSRIDAGLGRKEEAIQEGRRACEVLPVSKDAWFGTGQVRNLAWTYAWVGEKDLALEQLEFLQHEGGLDYGSLKLNPEWDLLRGDPRFERIVAALAPKN